MRYSAKEKAILVGIFNKTGLDIRMKMIVLEGDNLVELTTDKCIESKHLQGVYLFNTENIKPNTIVDDCNILAEMSNTADPTVKRYAKFSFGGIMDDKTPVDLEDIKAMIVIMQDSIDELIAEVV